MPDNSNIYDLEDDVPLFVGAAFEKLAGGPVTVAKLAAEYKPPTKNNMAALVKQLRKDSGDKTVNQDSWKVHFITEVLQHPAPTRARRRSSATTTTESGV